MQTFDDGGCVDEVSSTQDADQVFVDFSDLQVGCRVHLKHKDEAVIVTCVGQSAEFIHNKQTTQQNSGPHSGFGSRDLDRLGGGEGALEKTFF